MLSEQIFKNPPNEYRPIPFWFWNSKLRKDEIEAQIYDFHKKGLGGFFIHARFGLETEYLSRDWMDCIKCAVNTAEKLGMEVWLYDENGFPSGIGDLKVSRIKEYRPKFIDLTEGDVDAGNQIELNLPVGDVLIAYAYPKNNPCGEKIDLTSTVFESKLIWQAPDGEWSVAVYSKCTIEDPNDVVYGVDYLNPEAMRYFFDFTFDPYERAVGEHFGKTIKGIFTDEPTLLPWHHDINWYGQRSNSRLIVWNDLVGSEMNEKTGLNPQDFLPHLFFDINDDTPNIRQEYHKIVSRLYMKSFFDPYKKWCEEHNLKFTGHVLFEEGLYINTDFQSDITAALSRMDIPGTDHLGEATDSPYGGFSNLPNQLTNVQGEKLVSSVAHIAGKDKVISETYGCTGWGLTYQSMKRIADFQYTMGINMLCPHAMFYSIEGFRKTDAPPSENHMPGWENYKLFSDYIGRLSYILRLGSHSAKIALLYPLSNFWSKRIAGKVCEEDKVISDSFDLCASLLLKLHLDYDIITEEALTSAHLENGKLSIGNEDYEVLIASPFAVDNTAKEKIEEFVNQGGAWVFPPLSAGETQKEQLGRELSLARMAMGQNNFESLSEEVEKLWNNRQRHAMLDNDGQGKIIATLAGTNDSEGVMAALDGAVRDAIEPDIDITGPDNSAISDVRYIHRVIDSKHIYFIANSADQPAQCNIVLNINGYIEEWNPETGNVQKAKSTRLNDNHIYIDRTLPAFGSTIFIVDTDREFEVAKKLANERSELLVFPDEWKFEAMQPNALVLDKLTFTPNVGSSGTKYVYETSFNCDYVPKDLMLMLDNIEYRSSLMGGMNINIEVNGVFWHNPVMGSYIDKGFKTLDISKAVELGKNNIKITIAHSAWSGEPLTLTSPPVLLGNFSYHQGSDMILAPLEAALAESWANIGYPFYSGSVLYTHTFRVPRDIAGMRLIISIDSVRETAEIAVNGKIADIRLWQPWEADITDLVKHGSNTLAIKVTNTMANFLDKDPRPSGLIGKVRLLGEKRL